MHQSLAKFSESEASNHTPSLAGFTITTSGFEFSVHTGASLVLGLVTWALWGNPYSLCPACILASQ
jgi:hypothetical protein